MSPLFPPPPEAGPGDDAMRLEIEAIADGVCRVLDGDFSIRVGTGSADHTVQKLAMLINFLLATGERQTERLNRMNALLEARVAARTRELEEAQMQLRRALGRLEATHAHSEALFDAALDVIITIDTGGIIRSANRATRATLGYEPGELLGRNVSVLMPAPMRDEHDAYLHRYLATGEARVINVGREVTVRRRDGSTYLAFLTISEYRIGGRPYFVGFLRDIAYFKQREQQLRRLAELDPLTGVPNRSGIIYALERLLTETGEQAPGLVGLFYIDLDDFKPVNDTLGHDYGDALLIAVAERLRRRVRGSDLVGRLGGDEFVVVAGPVPTVGDIEHIRVTLAEALAQPFEVLDRELGLGGSIGVALYPRDGTTPEKLLRVADQSMYATKRRRKQRRHGPAPDGQAG